MNSGDGLPPDLSSIMDDDDDFLAGSPAEWIKEGQVRVNNFCLA
jgi:hypothetical protein